MKKILLLFILSNLLFSKIYSQDIIVLKTGDEIEAKITEVGLDNVKYKKYENINGPVYVILKNDIFMIKYENGSKDVFVEEKQKESTVVGRQPLTYKNGFWGVTIRQGSIKLSTSDIKRLYSNNAVALSKYEAGKALNGMATFAGITGGLALGYYFVSQGNGEEIDNSVVVIGAVSLLANIIMNISGNKMIKKSVDIFNSDMNASSSLSINFGTAQNGIGFSLMF